MLRLADCWVWDSWYVDDGETFHAFYLKASRALHDPDRRHHRASIGHAVSGDLRSWQELPDALVATDGPAFDDLATWTGSTVAGPDGRFHLFYTGISRAQSDRVQRIGHAVSDDLITWERLDGPVVCADPQWYETASILGHEPWRDPWVYFDASLDGWRMLITGSTADVHLGARGCVATAVSCDLVTWRVEAPLTEPAGFHQFEVPQTVVIDGQAVLVWCMREIDAGEQSVAAATPRTGTWSAPAASLTGPFDLAMAEPIAVPDTYAGRIVMDREGVPHLIAFADVQPDGAFGGYLIDPVPLRLTERGTLQPR